MAVYTIGKSFTFAAAHHLSGLPEGHQCARVHGHTYTVTVALGAPLLVGPGFVTDFGDLAPFGDHLKAELDHRDLNEVFEFEPTSERIAEALAVWFIAHVQPRIPGRLIAMRVSESATTWADYTVAAEATS
jgi:6-pyruvoyltetrahydropterin/6-carboxytetrahydropterin synthase